MTNGVNGIGASNRAVYTTSVPREEQAKQDLYSWNQVGPLTAQDKALLQDFCGYKFSWPPAPGQAFPREAMMIGQMRSFTGNVSDENLFSEVSRYQQTHLRLSGENAFTDDFLSFVAKRTSGAQAEAYLANRGESPHNIR